MMEDQEQLNKHLKAQLARQDHGPSAKIILSIIIGFFFMQLIEDVYSLYAKQFRILQWAHDETQINFSFINRGNSGQSALKIFNFPIQVGQIPKIINNIDYVQHGIFDKIQPASELDHLKISQKINLTKLYNDMSDYISYSLIVPKKNQKLQKQSQKIQIKSRSLELTDQTKPVQKKQLNQSQILELATRIAKYPNDPLVKQQEYKYYDQKYKIGGIKTQLPLCIFSMGFNVYSKNEYKEYFQSLQRQNYTNFHIVYVDDNSNDSSIQKIYEHLRQNSSRLINRIKFVSSFHRIGALANMYFWIRKLCNDDDIVLIIDNDDSLIGNQALKVLNSVYQDQNKWFVYTKYVRHNIDSEGYYDGISTQLKNDPQQYRTLQQIWVTSHLRTFRKKLMDAVPISYYIEFQYNSQTQMASGMFHRSAVDRFQVYSHLQLAGKDRIYHLNDFLYLYLDTDKYRNVCYRQRQQYDQYKSRIQTPLARLNSWSEPASKIDNYTVSQNLLAGLKHKYFQYQYCRKNFMS